MTKFFKTLQILAVLSLVFAAGCDKRPSGDDGGFTCTITSPKNGEKISIYEDLMVTVNAKSSDGTIALVTVWLDDAPYPCTLTAPYTATIPSSLLSVGSHKLKAIAITQTGTQQESAIVTITLFEPEGGNKPPTCSITKPTEGASFKYEEDIPVAVTAEDADGYIVSVQLYVDNEGYGSKNDFPYNFTINAKQLEAGTHALKAVAIDNQGAKKEATVNISIDEPILAVGVHYQGGIIAYLDETGKHGLIAAPEDQSTGIKWCNDSFIITGATGEAIGTGQSNTTKIVQAQGAGNYAAKLCDDLVLNGYDDWFLPSKDELSILYENSNVIGGFSNRYYWSSSEYSNVDAWYNSFYNNGCGYDSKNYIFRVRAVRAF